MYNLCDLILWGLMACRLLTVSFDLPRKAFLKHHDHEVTGLSSLLFSLNQNLRGVTSCCCEYIGWTKAYSIEEMDEVREEWATDYLIAIKFRWTEYANGW